MDSLYGLIDDSRRRVFVLFPLQGVSAGRIVRARPGTNDRATGLDCRSSNSAKDAAGEWLTGAQRVLYGVAAPAAARKQPNR
jgi:hypothetical protein